MHNQVRLFPSNVKNLRTLCTEGFGREWTVEDAGPYKIKKTIEHRSFETKGESMNNKIHVKPVGTGVLDGPKNQTNFHNQSANKKGIISRKVRLRVIRE